METLNASGNAHGALLRCTQTKRAKIGFILCRTGDGATGVDPEEAVCECYKIVTATAVGAYTVSTATTYAMSTISEDLSAWENRSLTSHGQDAGGDIDHIVHVQSFLSMTYARTANSRRGMNRYHSRSPV